MVELTKDKKSNTWILTKTDDEGFHKQMNLTQDEINMIWALILRVEFEKFIIGI